MYPRTRADDQTVISTKDKFRSDEPAALVDGDARHITSQMSWDAGFTQR